MPAFVLYLHGPYRKGDLQFYRRLARGKVCIAVDGGMKFFLKSKLRPDIIAGDFDSFRRDPAKLFPKSKLLKFPVEKDKTDTQLAIEYAISHRAKTVDIVQPFLGEADHFAGNLMLLASLVGGRGNRKIGFRIINPAYEIAFLRDTHRTIAGHRGETISVVPLTETIRLTCSGTLYTARNLRVHRGETVALRNQMSGPSAEISVHGQAFVFHQFGRRSDT